MSMGEGPSRILSCRLQDRAETRSRDRTLSLVGKVLGLSYASGLWTCRRASFWTTKLPFEILPASQILVDCRSNGLPSLSTGEAYSFEYLSDSQSRALSSMCGATYRQEVMIHGLAAAPRGCLTSFSALQRCS